MLNRKETDIVRTLLSITYNLDCPALNNNGHPPREILEDIATPPRISFLSNRVKCSGYILKIHYNDTSPAVLENCSACPLFVRI